jgi:tRNA(Ile)-lysidine synthase
MMTLLDAFRDHLQTLALPPGRALVAVSGGPDSVALLDLLHWTRGAHRQEMIVAHFDHGIHPSSMDVAAGVRALAGRYGLPYEEGQGALGRGAGETGARTARYAWLQLTRERSGSALVFTAHHADDQAETVLMRVVAGSGLAGLAGMRARAGWLVRPLLPFRRTAILRYVRVQSLPVWLDPANQDPRHLRSWLRVEVLPFLRTRMAVDDALLRVAGHAARERAAWDAVLDVLSGLDFRTEIDGFSVAAGPLTGYDSTLGQSVLMAAARRADCPLGPRRAARLLGLASTALSGATMALGEGWMAEMTFGRLAVHRNAAAGELLPLALEGTEGERRWGRWRLRWRIDVAPARQARSGLAAWFAAAPLVVRSWTPGERIRPLGGAGHRLLVRCFQDARVPRSRRGTWPVLAGPGGVVWIPGVSRSDAFLPEPGTEAVRVDAEHA